MTRVANAGDPPAAAARLEVQALPDCTSREELVARVLTRSRRIHFDDDPSGPLLRAVVAPSPRGGAVGELLITEANGKTSARRISAPSCAEATDAIGLIIALTLDPTSAATTRAPVPLPPVPPDGATAPSPPALAGAAELPSASGDRAEAPRAAEPSRALPQEGLPRPPSEGATAVAVTKPAPGVAAAGRFGAGAGAQAIVGATPNVLPGVVIYAMAGLDRDALFSPAAFVWGTHAATSGLIEPGGTAAFTLDAVSVDACALRAHVSVFEARACATGLYGRLAATGTETFSPTTAKRPFAMAGGALLLSVTIVRRLDISGRFGGGASLVREAFAFSPTVFYRTAAATFGASLQIGVWFP